MSPILAALTVLALVLLAEGHLRLRGVLSRRHPPPAVPPTARSVTVIRPVRGLDAGAEENVRAFLEMEYPGPLELLFVLDSEDDPAIPLIRRMMTERGHPGSRAEVLIAGPPPPQRTGKLNAMLVGVAAAKGELLAFNDSDTRPSKDLLARLVAALEERAGAGCTFAPVYAQADAPQAGDVGYGLLVNAWYGPTVAWAAEPHGELPFIMGQLMVFRRAALDAVGGVGCAEGQFVDDMYIGKRIAAAGWKNVVVESPLRVVTGGMGPWAFLRTFRRWILFSESGLPFRFTRPNWVRGVACWLAWGTGIAAVATGDWASAALAAVAIGVSVWTQAWLQRACHGPRIRLTQLWVPAVLPLVAAFVALSARLNRRVDWRGRSYDLDAEARLGAKGSPAAGT